MADEMKKLPEATGRCRMLSEATGECAYYEQSQDALTDLFAALAREDELRETIKSLRNDAWIMASDVNTTELRLAEKNCDWVAFKCAFNAVMKARRAGLARHEAAQAMLAAAAKGGQK